MIADSGYWADHDDLIVKARIKRAITRHIYIGKPACPTAEQIRHQFKLMEEKGMIKKTLSMGLIRYEITAFGHAWLKPWYQKIGAMLGNQLSTILTAAITSVIVFVLTEIVKRMLFN